MNQPTNHITRIRKYLVWLFWIAVWQTANLLIHNNIIFVGPLDMVKALAEQAADPAFWATILNSFARISLGFLGAFALSILLGSLAYLLPLRKSLRTRVTPVTSMLPVSLFSMFHCSVKSSTVFRSGFWMQAAVAKGCG